MSRAERITEVKARASGLVGHVRPVTLAGERTFPLSPPLDDLFPLGGMRRGTTVVVSAGAVQGTGSLAFALAAAASAAGSWCAAVGMPDLGLVAVAELGLLLDRLVLVPEVAPDQWVTVVGALLDAVDVLVVRPPAHLRQGDARRLITRARERGAVLIPLVRHGRKNVWDEGAAVRLVVTRSQWEGPGSGAGHLMRRRLQVSAGGRGAAARHREIDLWLPAAEDGGLPTALEEDAPRYAGSDAELIPDAKDTKTLRSAG